MVIRADFPVRALAHIVGGLQEKPKGLAGCLILP